MKNKFFELTRLISIMTATERRRFSAEFRSGLHSKSGQLPIGLVIFQILGAMNEYDEVVFHKKLKKAIADPRQLKKVMARLPVERLYLQERLMLFLRNMNAGYYPSMQIKELLIDAKILMERGLVDLSQQALDKAREKAIETENNLALLEINREQRTLMYSQVNNIKALKTILSKLIGENETRFQFLKEELYYQDLYDSAAAFADKNNGATEHEDIMNKLRQAEPLLNQLDSLPNLGGYRLLGAFSNLVNARNDAKMHNPYTLLLAQWWEDHPQLIAENPLRYMLNVANALTNLVTSKDNSKYISLRDKLKKRVAMLPYQELAEFRFVNRIELFWYLNNKKMDEAYQKAKEIDAGYKKYGSLFQPSLRIAVVYNNGIAYFVNGKYEEALLVFNRLRRYAGTGERRDIIYQAELLGLICVFELSVNKLTSHPDEDRHSDPLESRFRRVNRLFKGYQLAEDSYEMTLLGFHKRIMYAGGKKRKEAIAAMKQYLLPFSDDSVKMTSGATEHLAWLDSLSQSKSIRQIYLEKPD